MSPGRHVLFLALFLLVQVPIRAQSGAFDLLEEVRRAYSSLTAYADRGEIEIVEPTASSPTTLRFETRREGESFRLVVEGEGLHRVLTRGPDGVRLDDLELGQYRRLDSLATGLVEILGREHFDALAVATTVVGSPAALAEPDAAALEGLDPCGESTCHLLALTRQKGSHETLLWIDRESYRIRAVEIVVRPAGDSLHQALAEAGLDKAAPALASASGPRTYRVRHEIVPASELTAAGPPAGGRQVEAWERPEEKAGAEAVASETAAPFAFDETISVELFEIRTRVVDSHGAPVPDLRPEDFEILVGREVIPVVSVDWVSSDPSFRDERLEAELASHGVRLDPVEKLVVVFVQAGMHATRTKGHLKTMPFFEEFLESLQGNDRVAVVSFDSHLKLWLDFTRRHGEVIEAVSEAILFGNRPLLGRRSETEPSFARHFDFRAAKKASSPEQALEVVGRTLEPIPGDKILVYLGWGMGRFGKGGVTMTPDYGPAVEALLRSRTTVFVLDVTYAGYHSLEVGLQNVAAQTGGTYAKTSLFPRRATGQLARTLTGHYVLTFSGADVPEGEGVLRIRLKEKKGRVVADKFRLERLELAIRP